MRARLASLTATALIAAACGAPAAPASSVAPPSASPTAAFRPSPSPAATAAPPASPTPAVAGHWEAAGTMHLGRLAPHVVPLADGHVLVVGNDAGLCIRANSVQTEVWSPATTDETAGWSWWQTALAKPRADFVAVPLKDGRVLVTGGVDPGSRSAAYWSTTNQTTAGSPIGGDHRSYSSTFIYAPRSETAGWSRAGSLGTARTAPAAAVLLDGRVLVAGGYYLGRAAIRPGPGSAIVLAAYRPGPILFNGPPEPDMVPSLATVELYDPATDAWSVTGPMHYARVAPGAVTLADGRVLVVGSSVDALEWRPQWNYTQADVAGRAYETAELYDPRTGRFTLTGGLPAVEVQLKAGLALDFSSIQRLGTLVALADGGALLVGRTESGEWYDGERSGYVTVVRTLRLEPITGAWTEIDRSVQADDGSGSFQTVVSGRVNPGAVVVALEDGLVLVAGGQPIDAGLATDAAALYDPATGTWTALPPMPEHRAGGTAVALPDGSALLVGGYYEPTSAEFIPDCEEGPTGLASTVRFVPGP